MRPVDHLSTAKLYPRAWRLVEEFRRGRGKDLPKWPGWCFMPMAGWYAIVCDDAGTSVVPKERVPDIGRLAAIGAWRYTQGIYRFDPTVFDSLWETKLSGDIPAEVLLRMPQWSVYIETPGKTFGEGNSLHGYWAHLEWDANDQRRELRLLLDTEEALMPIPLHVGEWDIESAVRRATAEMVKHLPPGMMMDVSSDRLNNVASALTPMVSLVLYLCSGDPDFGPAKRPERPRPKKTKKGWRLFPPSNPTIWHIGERIGHKIRRSAATAQDGTGKTVAPHIRSAHWHGYWTGPKTGHRKYIYHWIPPIPVGMEKYD